MASPWSKKWMNGLHPSRKLQTCYNINDDEGDDPRKVNIAETKGQRDEEGPGVELPFIGQPIKIKKVNIIQ